MGLRLLTLISLVVAPPALAIDHDVAVWTGLVGAVKTDGRFDATFEAHVRRDGARSTAILRPAVGVKLSDHWSTHAGYAWIPTLPDGGSVINEHRAWSQVLGSASLGERVRVQSRTRLEHRFAKSGQVGHRARKFIRFDGAPSPSGGATPVLWNELFLGLNATEWGATAGVDQNRLFVGAALPTTRGGRFELGLLHVTLPRQDLTMTWVAAANWFPSINLGQAR